MTVQAASTATQHQEQLDRLNAEVEALRQQLKRSQRLAAVGTMTAMVAHEFNNILTPIINYAQMAKSNPALTAKAIAKAADGGQRASHICKAILGITREGPVELEEVKLAELVDQTISAMAREPAKDAIEMSLKVDQALSVRTRRVEIQQVLLNLLINARTAVLGKTGQRRIALVAGRQGRWVNIKVDDNGVGIAPENIEKIFQPFFTTRKADSDEGPGSGLGLAICREIVTALGGQISVTSTLGHGTMFSVNLPA